MKWTSELKSAAARVACDHTEVKYRDALMADCRSRAQEYAFVKPGYELSPAQVSYTSCLRQRLVSGVPSHDAFEKAWGEAWNKEREVS